MRKTINSKIFRFVSILLFSCFLGGLTYFDALASGPQSITVYSNIYNSTSIIDAEFQYKIEPVAGNPTGATNEPTSLTISFDDIAPSNVQTTVTAEIDFSDTRYTKLGTYKYIVEEVSSSNSDYPISGEKYEIYVVESATGREVYQQAKNLEDNTKGDINFNHDAAYSYITINLTVHGDEVDKREFFKFRVFMDSFCAGCQYDILGQDEYVNFDGNTVKTSDKYITSNTLGRGHHVQYAVKKSGKNEARYATSEASRGRVTQPVGMALVSDVVTENNIYLKDGQSVTIGLSPEGKFQIPVGTKVKVMADETLNERKWTMYVDGIETEELQHVVGQDVDFDILIERNMLVPYTGLFYEVLPFVLLMLVGAGGVIVFVKMKAKNAR